MHEQITLRFFDTELALWTDTPMVATVCASLYGRFVHDGSGPAPATRVSGAVHAHEGNPWGEPVLVIDGEKQPLPQWPLWEGDACDRAVGAALSRVRSHWLVHAAAVACGERGILLVADANHGKTTLALELARRGLGFLGDDFVALGRADRRLYAFPKSLRLWPQTLRQFGFDDMAEQAFYWAYKYQIDIETLYPHRLATPVPLTDIILLRDPAEAIEGQNDGLDHNLDLLPERYDDDLLDAVRRLDGVRHARAICCSERTGIRVRTRDRERTTAAVQALCQERGMRLLGFAERFEIMPDFSGPASLSSLSGRAAVFAIWQRLRGGVGLAPGGIEEPGQAARLFLELASTISSARCHELRLGPLADMADLVCSLASE